MNNKLTIKEVARKAKLYIEGLPTEDFYGKIIVTFVKGKPKELFSEEKELANSIR